MLTLAAGHVLKLNYLYGGRYNDKSRFKIIYLATNIVMSLAEDVLDEGRCIYVDNHHSSFELLNKLGKCTTDVIGTVRKDCKTLPKDVANSKLNKRETKTANSSQYNAIISLLINIYNTVMGGVD